MSGFDDYLDVVCPKCAAAVEAQCSGPGLGRLGYHESRRRLSTANAVGPTPGQTVLRGSAGNEKTFLVASVDQVKGIVRLRVRYGRRGVIADRRERDEFAYDVERGVWRLSK